MELDTSRSLELGADPAPERKSSRAREQRLRVPHRAEVLLVWMALQLPWLLCWGFSVDDAWISGRVARHLAQGFGHRFNVEGPLQDAVTPLGWAHVLSWLPASGVTDYVAVARWLGVLAWSGASVGLAQRCVGTPLGWRCWLVVGPLSLCLPLGAWLGAGMETGWVTALATAGVVFPRLGPALLGWAAAWRPELIPWAALAVGAGQSRRDGLRRAALLMVPVLLVALWRYAWFGRVVPLAFYAKPSDLGHGFSYAWGALQFGAIPVLLLSVRVRRLSSRGRRLLVAIALHWVAMVLAGGDWMTLFRLAVPVLPSATLVALELLRVAPLWASTLRAGMSLGLSGVLASTHLASVRGVWQQRLSLIETARHHLVAPVGGVDIGWMGAATEGKVVDFAGVTDTGVAFLPGGHTSKVLSSVFVSKQGVVTWVVSADAEGRPRYAVDARLLGSDVSQDFELVAQVPLANSPYQYLIYRFTSDPISAE